MKIATLGLVAALCVGLAGSVAAGTNAGGFLLMHTDNSVTYTADDAGNYCNTILAQCGFDAAPCPPFEADQDCIDFLVDLNPTSSKAAAEPAVFWVIGAFPQSEDVCPRVAGVTFGLSWPVTGPQPTFVDFASCSDFELPSGGWPGLSSGTAVTWSNALRKKAFPVYWFAAYSYYGPLQISIARHATQGIDFADDSVPSVLDPIDAGHRGSVGLNGATGSNPYEPGPTPLVESSWGEVKSIFGQ